MPCGLDYRVWSGWPAELGSSLSDLLRHFLLTRCVVGCVMVLARREVSEDAQTCSAPARERGAAPQVGRVRYQPGDRLWLSALSRLILESRLTCIGSP
jgi:hypothetical protein